MTATSYAGWMSTPEVVSYMLFLRYCYGKDLMTDYSARISSVTPARVNPVLDGLATGGIAEYVVRGMPVPISDPVLSEPPLPQTSPLVPFPGSFAYPLDGAPVPLDTLSLSDLEDLPVREYAPDSTWYAVRDSMFRAWGRPVPGETGPDAPADTTSAVPADTVAAPADSTVLLPADTLRTR